MIIHILKLIRSRMGGQRMDTGRVAGGVRGDLVHDQLLLDDG